MASFTAKPHTDPFLSRVDILTDTALLKAINKNCTSVVIGALMTDGIIYVGITKTEAKSIVRTHAANIEGRLTWLMDDGCYSIQLDARS